METYEFRKMCFLIEKNDEFRRMFNAMIYLLLITYPDKDTVLDALYDTNPTIVFTSTGIRLLKDDEFIKAYRAYARIAESI